MHKFIVLIAYEYHSGVYREVTSHDIAKRK